MPVGHQLAQLVHAAGLSVTEKLDPTTHAVVLHCCDQTQLTAIYRDLKEAHVDAVLVCEPDAPYLGAPTAIGIRPGPRKPLRGILGRLPLAFKEQP